MGQQLQHNMLTCCDLGVLLLSLLLLPAFLLAAATTELGTLHWLQYRCCILCDQIEQLIMTTQHQDNKLCSPNKLRVIGFGGGTATTGSGCTTSSTCAGCGSAAACTVTVGNCCVAGIKPTGFAATGAGGGACCCCCLSPHSQQALVGVCLCCKPIGRLCDNILSVSCLLVLLYVEMQSLAIEKDSPAAVVVMLDWHACPLPV